MNIALGVVLKNYDADHPGMVQVNLPDFAKDGGETAWMPVMSPYAGKNYGIYFLPEKDEQVVVGFMNDDPHNGIVLGSLWNQKNALPADTATEENTVRLLMTKGGHKVLFKDGDEGCVTVKTKAGHTIEILEKEKKMKIATSDGKEVILLEEESGAVSVTADKKITLKAQDISLEGKLSAKGQTIKLESDGSFDIKGKQLKLDGSTLKANGQNAEVTGANVKVESSGILTLKGSMAKIN